jgi:putative intracellular protease/amidase
MPKSFASLVKVGRQKEGTETKTIAFVAYPGLTLLDLIAPMTTFLGLTRGLVGTSRHYRTVCVAERVETIGSDTPMSVVPDNAFEEVPAPFAIIVPGGGRASLEAMGNERLIN